MVESVAVPSALSPRPSGRSSDYRYDGFISDSRSADAVLAPKIQDGLERLAKPWKRRRALTIFQDVDDLPADPDLKAVLLAKLRRSRSLVYLASPRAATSEWCNEEIRDWLEQRGSTGLIIVLTAGELEFVTSDDNTVACRGWAARSLPETECRSSARTRPTT